MTEKFTAAPQVILSAAEHVQRNAWAAGCIVFAVIAPAVCVAVWRWWRQR